MKWRLFASVPLLSEMFPQEECIGRRRTFLVLIEPCNHALEQVEDV
jgi:hypothetical protein